MRCPVCEKFVKPTTINCRQNADGDQIRRRRECPKCGSRWTTYERIEVDTANIQPGNVALAS